MGQRSCGERSPSGALKDLIFQKPDGTPLALPRVLEFSRCTRGEGAGESCAKYGFDEVSVVHSGSRFTTCHSRDVTRRLRAGKWCVFNLISLSVQDLHTPLTTIRVSPDFSGAKHLSQNIKENCIFPKNIAFLYITKKCYLLNMQRARGRHPVLADPAGAGAAADEDEREEAQSVGSADSGRSHPFHIPRLSHGVLNVLRAFSPPTPSCTKAQFWERGEAKLLKIFSLKNARSFRQYRPATSPSPSRPLSNRSPPTCLSFQWPRHPTPPPGAWIPTPPTQTPHSPPSKRTTATHQQVAVRVLLKAQGQRTGSNLEVIRVPAPS